MTLDLTAADGVARFADVRDRDLADDELDLARWLLVEPDQVATTGDPGVAGYDGPAHLGRWFDWSAPFSFPDWFLTDDHPLVRAIRDRDLTCLERLGVAHDVDVVRRFARYTAQDVVLSRAGRRDGPTPPVVLDLGPGNGRLANPFLHGDDRAAVLVAVEGIVGPYLTQRAYYSGLGLRVADYLEAASPEAFDVTAATRDHDVVHLPTWRLDLVPDASVDLACAVQVLKELPPATVRFVLRHLQRIVRPGGALYVRDHLEGHDLTGLPTDDLVADHGFTLAFAPQVRDRVDLHGLPRLWRRSAGG